MEGRERMTARAVRYLVTAACVVLAPALEARYEPEVVVADPYIELRTGPGRGYPIFYVAAQGDRIVILKERTEWYKVRTPRGKEGWVDVTQMQSTLDLNGEAVDFPSYDLSDFERRRFELGFSGGDFGGAALLSVRGAFALTPTLSTELTASQILGDYSDGWLGSASIVMTPFPSWRVSPFFNIGTGVVHVEPQTTVVQAEDRTDEVAHVGVGANIYLSRRFILRMEYRRHTVLTSRDDNQEIDEWKAGFSVFL
jgi:uncharacterized protein YgiM (DUF1202 family)